MKNTRQLVPAARKTDLVIQEVEGETLVYDLKSHKAHCLNQMAALVWKHCDGEQSLEQLARKVSVEMRAKVSPEVVWLAVEQLEKRRLLEERLEIPDGAQRMSRRELARRLGIAAAVVTLPLITSINAPAALQAASCGMGGATCGAGFPPCCPGFICVIGLNVCQAT